MKRKRNNTLVTYTYPRSSHRAVQFEVRVNGQEVFVYDAGLAAMACISFAGRITVEVTVKAPVQNAVVRPLSKKVKPTIKDGTVRFTLDRPANLCVEIDGLLPLFFYGNPLETKVPALGAPGVHYFKAGQVYEVGELALQSGETLYIEGGAVVKGCIRACGVEGITLRGRGIFDGSFYRRGVDGRRLIVLENCRAVRVEGLILVEPSTWMLVLGACQNVHIQNIKELSKGHGNDGIDVVGCQDVLIEDCFIKTNDDCIVIKAFDCRKNQADAQHDWSCDVDGVLVRRCVLMTVHNGTAMEIGYELRTGTVRNVTFRDCDVLHVHGFGSVFGIHNGDRAVVQDITWDNIRVEHCYDKLVDFRILRSRWNRDQKRGQVRNVRLRNIRWTRTPYNEGYTASLIGGYDGRHTIRDVVFENCRIDGKRVTRAADFPLYTAHAAGLVFK